MERVNRICNEFLKVYYMNEANIESKPKQDVKVEPSTALKEVAMQYIAIIIILISNLWQGGDWQTILTLALAYAVFLFTGWIKKLGEVKINEILAKSGLKDKEILILKEVRIKLESEVERLTKQLTDLSLGNIPQLMDKVTDNLVNSMPNKEEKNDLIIS